MSDIITNVVPSGPYGTTTINNGGLVVGSPRGSGFLDGSYTLGAGYSGTAIAETAIPATGTVGTKYDTRFTGCAPCQ
tara:strand:+ start:4415 stop:4645 length:231 start_codon:yes stop_codon:yes gene_type:complete